MRETVFFVASLVGAAILTALAVLNPEASLFWKNVLSVGIIILAICAFALAIDIIRSRWPKEQKMIPILGVIIIGLGFIGCTAWYFWPSIQDNARTPGITKEFELARTSSLGNSLHPIETTKGTEVYLAAHEHALVISLLPLLDVFVLPSDLEHKAIRQHTSTFQDDRNWFDIEYLKKTFDPPEGKNPPEYRVAELWSKNREQWQWIGWREWSCFWDLEDKFYYQEFENGIILGIFPTGEIISESQIFTVANNGEWASRISSSVGAPACNEKNPRVNGVVVHGHFVKSKADGAKAKP